MARSKDLKKLRKALRHAGWRVEIGRRNHYKAYCPCGEHLIVISSSPRKGRRSYKNLVSELRRTECDHLPVEVVG